jgi:hypothetical protein
MFQAKPILRFLGWFVLIFGLLVAPWPGWPEAYAKAFYKGGKLIYGSLGRKGIVSFRPNRGDKALDTMVFIWNREKLDARMYGPSTTFTFSSRNMAYFPTALMVALVLASPVGWRRRLWALLWALLWINVFIYLSVGVMILMKLGVNQWLDLMTIPPWLDKTVLVLDELFLAYPGPRFAVAVLIWILVTFKRDDWKAILGKGEVGADSPRRKPASQG